MSSLLEKHYADSKNFMARIELNRRFGTNPYQWTLWIFDQFKFPKGARVLEIGCGNALLWRSNLDRVPYDVNILLSDFSEGMLNDARKILSDAVDRFEYDLIVTEAKPLVNYVLSFGNIKETLKGAKREEFRDYIAEILKRERNIKITKDTGIL
jgi:cyclopropane fatty-acyl-phospholipid synthase-like methyltransferase